MAIPKYIQNAWSHMMYRCYNPKAPNYKWYGGRGIGVCERWRAGMQPFWDDMGDRPSNKHWLDRIDGDGDYCPENCRWATTRQQALSRSTTRWIEFNGNRMCLSDWAKSIGISSHALRDRLDRHPLHVALTAPKQPTGRTISAR